MTSPKPPSLHAIDRRGLIFGLGAYLSWGLIPLYFKLLKSVPSVDIVAHRVLWSLLVVGVLVLAARGWPAVRAVLANRRAMLILVASSLMIGRAISRIPRVLLTDPASRVKRNDRQYFWSSSRTNSARLPIVTGKITVSASGSPKEILIIEE